MAGQGLDQQQVYALIARLAGQANILTIPRLFIDWTGDHISALLLAQVIYWSSRTEDPEGWFYKSAKEWEAELGISDYQLARATKKLANAGLATKLKKAGGAPTLHYRLDQERFLDWISEKLGNGFLEPLEMDFRESGKSISERVVNPFASNSAMDYRKSGQSLTETTTETIDRENLSNHSKELHITIDQEDAERIAWVIQDLGRELHDQASAKASASRACRLYAQSGLSLDAFLDALQTARVRTQRYSASIKAAPVPKDNGWPAKPKMAYFFAVLDDLVQRTSTPQPQRA